MKNIIKFFTMCAIAIGIAYPTMAKASAPTGVTLTLSSLITGTTTGASSTETLWNIGDTGNVYLNISNLKASVDLPGSPALGGYSVVLNYDASKLAVSSVTQAALSNNASSDFTYVDSTSTPGQLTLDYFSADTAANLEATQLNHFNLATITFQVEALGSSSVTLDPSSSLSDENGDSLAVVNNNNITVVPEPSTYVLGGLGLLVVLAKARRKLSLAA